MSPERLLILFFEILGERFHYGGVLPFYGEKMVSVNSNGGLKRHTAGVTIVSYSIRIVTESLSHYTLVGGYRCDKRITGNQSGTYHFPLGREDLRLPEQQFKCSAVV